MAGERSSLEQLALMYVAAGWPLERAAERAVAIHTAFDFYNGRDPEPHVRRPWLQPASPPPHYRPRTRGALRCPSP